jgi:hypothetical protein
MSKSFDFSINAACRTRRFGGPTQISLRPWKRAAKLMVPLQLAGSLGLLLDQGDGSPKTEDSRE